MSTYKQIFYHIIFATKHRQPTIAESNCHKLYNYIFGIIKNKDCQLYRINGMPDHLHIFSSLHPSISLADFVKEIKRVSSVWMKESGYFPQFTYWQEGYGAFTYSIKEKEKIIRYIRNQKEHHQTISFLDEYRGLLEEQGLTFDERYLM